MTQCTNFDDISEQQCTREAVKAGLCDVCFNLMQSQKTERSSAVTPPPTAIQWTPQQIKATFGAIASSKDGSGGMYWGGGKSEWHVHIYNDGGAHVKIGVDEIRFMHKPTYRFDRDRFFEGVSKVKLRANGEADRNRLLGSMILAVATYGGLAQNALAGLIQEVRS
jgi:hypothetical protein